MRLPTLLLRRNPRAHKNDFGHVLILAGSRNMAGAAALCSLACIRTGAGLVTVGIPESLNSVIHKKISSTVMTFPLKETSEQTLSLKALPQIHKRIFSFDVIALGPGLSVQKGTKQLVHQIIKKISKPLVLDADALNALAGQTQILTNTKTVKILTPHPGEMAHLTGLSKGEIEKNPSSVAKKFAKTHRCILLLKGHRTIVASSDGRLYRNRTGNAGMATAGSGDVLTGMIAALLAQGLCAFDAAKYGAYLHGLAGDLAAKEKTKAAMIAVDIIEKIPNALRLSAK